MKAKIFQFLPIVLFVLGGLWIPQLVLAWPDDPTVNVPICTASDNQLFNGYVPPIVSDGAGGAILTWEDYRSGTYSDIYAQRVDASGNVQWTTNGVPICTSPGSQSHPTLASDGAGGAIITWSDPRNGTDFDIYAQRVDASGTIQWTINGVTICTASGSQVFPILVSDGSGGAIITWRDDRNSSDDANIYAQHVDASGTVQWTTNGVPISIALSPQYLSGIVSDGAGGAVMAWRDDHSGSPDIYVQRVNASGTVQWTTDGVAICTALDTQDGPTLVSDGTGGAIITWYDYRNSYPNVDIYAQRVNASGAVQWTTNGVPICTASNIQWVPTIASDGAGGAIITWSDYRSSLVTSTDIYTQRVNASGAVQWKTNGVPICTNQESQGFPTLVSDGAGGAIIAWGDYRSVVNSDIYAQRVEASGELQWTTDGVPICTALAAQDLTTLVSDGTGGAIIAWRDYRTGITSDIYAQRVFSDSSLPVTLSSFTATLSDEKVTLRWRTEMEINNLGFSIYRSERKDGPFLKIGWRDSAGNSTTPHNYQFIDEAAEPGRTYYFYYIESVDTSGGREKSPILIALPETQLPEKQLIAPSRTAFFQNYPNPFNPETWMPYQLAERADVKIRIFTIQGELIRTLNMGPREPGFYVSKERAAYWDGRNEAGERVGSGVYLYTIQAGRFMATRRMVVSK